MSPISKRQQALSNIDKPSDLNNPTSAKKAIGSPPSSKKRPREGAAPLESTSPTCSTAEDRISRGCKTLQDTCTKSRQQEDAAARDSDDGETYNFNGSDGDDDASIGAIYLKWREFKSASARKRQQEKGSNIAGKSPSTGRKASPKLKRRRFDDTEHPPATRAAIQERSRGSNAARLTLIPKQDRGESSPIGRNSTSVGHHNSRSNSNNEVSIKKGVVLRNNNITFVRVPLVLSVDVSDLEDGSDDNDDEDGHDKEAEKARKKGGKGGPFSSNFVATLHHRDRVLGRTIPRAFSSTRKKTME